MKVYMTVFVSLDGYEIESVYAKKADAAEFIESCGYHMDDDTDAERWTHDDGLGVAMAWILEKNVL